MTAACVLGRVAEFLALSVAAAGVLMCSPVSLAPSPAFEFVAGDPEFGVAVVIPVPPAAVIGAVAVVVHAGAFFPDPVAIALVVVVLFLLPEVAVKVADLTGGKELISGCHGLFVVNEAFQAVLVLVERVEGIQSPFIDSFGHIAFHVFVIEGVIELIVVDNPVVIRVSEVEEVVSESVGLLTVPVVIVVVVGVVVVVVVVFIVFVDIVRAIIPESEVGLFGAELDSRGDSSNKCECEL